MTAHAHRLGLTAGFYGARQRVHARAPGAAGLRLRAAPHSDLTRAPQATTASARTTSRTSSASRRRSTRRVTRVPALRRASVHLAHWASRRSTALAPNLAHQVLDWGFDSIKLDGCGAQENVEIWYSLYNWTAAQRGRKTPIIVGERDSGSSRNAVADASAHACLILHPHRRRELVRPRHSAQRVITAAPQAAAHASRPPRPQPQRPAHRLARRQVAVRSQRAHRRLVPVPHVPLIHRRRACVRVQCVAPQRGRGRGRGARQPEAVDRCRPHGLCASLRVQRTAAR